MGIQSIPEHELARLREKAKEITGSQFDYQSSYTELLSRRLNGEPLQYIEEYVPFYSIQINVDQRCLIPRPETEYMIEIIKNNIDTPKKILDVGTGTGCIALMMKKLFPDSEVHAVDISNDAFKFRDIKETYVAGIPCVLSRLSFTGELGYEIYCDGATTDHLGLWDFLIKIGEPHGMEFSSTRAMTIRRIEGGILGNITDIDTTMTPFEAGLGAFVDMDKENFVGRKALLEKDTGCLLFGLTCKGATPISNSEIIQGEKMVGRITAGVPSPTLNLGIGYARFLTTGDWVGKSLTLRLPNGSEHICDIVDLPFFDKERQIVRGIDKRIP